MENSGVERKLSHGKEAQLGAPASSFLSAPFLQDAVKAWMTVSIPYCLLFSELSIGELQLAASMDLPQKMSVGCLEGSELMIFCFLLVLLIYSFTSACHIFSKLFIQNWKHSNYRSFSELSGKFLSAFSSLHSYLCMFWHVSSCLGMSLYVFACDSYFLVVNSTISVTKTPK